MRLPEIRTALHVLASDIEAKGMTAEAGKLRTLADETKRRPAVRRAPPRSMPMTPAIEDRIRDTALAHPSWSMERIGAYCGVSQARVSETLAGFRQ